MNAQVMIDPPNPSDTRSVLADWMELCALLDSRSLSTRSSLFNVLDILEDNGDLIENDPETGELLDEAILEENRHRLLDVTFQELEYRQNVLGECYPFIVDGFRHRLELRGDARSQRVGRVVYLFCLLTCAIRERRFQPITTLEGAERGIANAFQICSCLAAGGYISGEVSSFGFPRATGTNFLDALRATFARFGAGEVRQSEDLRAGMPTELKDGGIDVIAWRHHPDGMPGKLYMIGQCASGKGWRAKSVRGYIEQLDAWFSQLPGKYPTPAMFIPFPLHHDLEEPAGSYLEAVKTQFWYSELQFGVIFDRFRIAYFADLCMALETKDHVDGSERFNQVADWVRSTREAAGLVHA